MNGCYDKRSGIASAITKSVADKLHGFGQIAVVLSHDEFLSRLRAMRDAGQTRNADLARLLDLPTPRIAEIFAGKRQVKVDEMKAIIERYQMDDASPVSAETIEPLLDALLPLAPSGRLTDQSRRALAESLAYGLELLSGQTASTSSSDALLVAARAAAARFRETDLAA